MGLPEMRRDPILARRVRNLAVRCAFVPIVCPVPTRVVVGKWTFALRQHALAIGIANMIEFTGIVKVRNEPS